MKKRLEEKDFPLTVGDKERFVAMAMLLIFAIWFQSASDELILRPSIDAFIVPVYVSALVACFWGIYFILKSGLKKTNIRHDCSKCFGGF